MPRKKKSTEPQEPAKCQCACHDSAAPAAEKVKKPRKPQGPPSDARKAAREKFAREAKLASQLRKEDPSLDKKAAFAKARAQLST